MGIMSLAEIMDKSIGALRKYIKSIALFTVGYGIVAFILIFLIIVIGAVITAFTASGLESFWAIGIFLGLTAILAVDFAVSLYAGTIRIASQEYTGEQIFAQDAIRTSFKSIFKVFGIIFCGVVMFIPVGAAIGGIGYVIYKAFDENIDIIALYQGREIIFVIVPILFILAVIFIISAYVTWFSFTLNALVIEKKGVFGSIKRSFSLVRHNYWRIFGCTILFGLTVAALRASIDTLLAAVSTILFFILKLLSISNDFITFFSMIYNYANWPINLITWMVISPIGVIMTSMLYYNQRFKKEGYDIVLRLREIEKKEEREQLSEIVKFNDSH
jgi:hypothetical protein